MTVDEEGMPIINIIAGGVPYTDESIYLMSSAGDKRKRVNTDMKEHKISTLDRMVISFSEEDKKGVIFPHNDALVVTPVIGNYGIQRTLIDKGSAVNLFSLEVYELLKQLETELEPCEKPIIGVRGIPIPVKGTMLLSVYFREDGSKRREELLFVVVDINLPYNAILELPFLNRFGAVISLKHLRMKYLSWDGVVSV